MTESNATAHTKPLSRRIARLLRFIAFLCTGGWAFPHVCTEDMDLTRLQNDQTRGVH